jgi:hypothetical protein
MAIPFLSPPVTPGPPLPPRRRGGQPLNRNARTHGFYSRHPPAPLARFSHVLDRYRQFAAQRDPVAIARAIPDLHGQMELLFTICETLLATGQISLFVVLHKFLNKTINISMQYKLILHKHHAPFHDLQFVAGHALDLISYGFWEHRITRDADSFRSGQKKSDLNSLPFKESLLPPFSEPDFPFLTARQTQLLHPLLPPSIAKQLVPEGAPEGTNPHVSPLGEDLGRPALSSVEGGRRWGRKACPERSRRGRPPADPSAMLDAVFWKTAHRARWQDLPVGYPSMFPCRRYYRRIFRSGRLLTIYRALYEDFCTCGGFDLTALVGRDCFEINE